jgi:cell division protein ZipA
MGPRELLILLLILAIIAVVLRGLFVALRSRKNKIKIALDKNIPVYDLEELELRELPNGGARMVQRSFDEVMKQNTLHNARDTFGREADAQNAGKPVYKKALKTDLSRAASARRAAEAAALTGTARTTIKAESMSQPQQPLFEELEAVAPDAMPQMPVAEEPVVEPVLSDDALFTEAFTADAGFTPDSDAEYDSDAGYESAAGFGSVTGAGFEAQSEAETESDSESLAGFEAEVVLEQPPEPIIESAVEDEAEVEPQYEAQHEPEYEPEYEPEPTPVSRRDPDEELDDVLNELLGESAITRPATMQTEHKQTDAIQTESIQTDDQQTQTRDASAVDSDPMPGREPEPEPEVAPEYEPVYEPEPEPEYEPEPEPEYQPDEQPQAQRIDDDMPDFDSEYEAEPEPQPSASDSFSANHQDEEDDTLFEDEDRQRRIDELEQKGDTTSKRFLSWAGSALSKLAESRAAMAEKAAVKAAEKASAKERAEQQARADQAAAEQRRAEQQASELDQLADYQVDDVLMGEDYRQSDALFAHDDFEEDSDDRANNDWQQPEPSAAQQSPYQPGKPKDQLSLDMDVSDSEQTQTDWNDKNVWGTKIDEQNDHAEAEEQTDQDDQGYSEVLVINVMARPNTEFHGDEMLQVLLSAGLRFGEMSIFHRYADRRAGPVLFSVANALNPGTFDLNRISEFSTQGLCFFMTLLNVASNMIAFDQMLATARHVQAALDAELKDDNRSVMTAQTVEYYRQRVRDFELQQRKNASAR